MTQPEPSSGLAGTVATVIAILGAINLAYPCKIPFLPAVLQASPVITVALPLVMTIGGSLYAAASSAIPWLRRLLPWKPARPATPGPLQAPPPPVIQL